ncbi:MAG: hypothetical protein M1419_00225 [Bacteroidetes bacterium]|nr:hypothetical protein [Bacteroidota bacterium]
MKKARINQSPMLVTNVFLFIAICHNNQENKVNTYRKPDMTSRTDTPSPLFLKKINKLKVIV